jgi:hypothetical protein
LDDKPAIIILIDQMDGWMEGGRDGGMEGWMDGGIEGLRD